MTTHIFSQFHALRNRVAATKVPAVIKSNLRFVRDEEGVTAIEYGLIAALIAIVIIASVQLVGTDLAAVFSDIAASI